MDPNVMLAGSRQGLSDLLYEVQDRWLSGKCD